MREKADRSFCKLGGILGILGGVGYIVGGAIHQDLPGGPENAVPHVADRPEWHAVHLLIMLSVALWPVAFAGLVTSLNGVWSNVIGRISVGAMLAGFVLYAIEMAIDGYVLKNIADSWAAASGASRDELFLVAEAVFGVLQGIFVASVIWAAGVPFVLLGLAIAVGRPYPRWLGLTGSVLGLIVAVSGMTSYLGFELVPHVFGYVLPSFLLAIWLSATGILMWRRASTDPEPASGTVNRRRTGRP